MEIVTGHDNFYREAGSGAQSRDMGLGDMRHEMRLPGGSGG